MRLFLSLLLSFSLTLSTLPAAVPIQAAASETATEQTSDTSNANDTGQSADDTDTSDDTQAADDTTAAGDAAQSADLADTLGLSAPSVVLMEATTGTVIYEKDSHTSLHPASITKIMTLILIFDALEKGTIHLEDTVTVSDYAASMGGSQVFLEAGETQTVDTMIKCIAVASANDACVAMAELISGSEAAFVEQMNERAAGLGMTDTHFVNCCGLDTDGHMASAYDVALMSRELITKYPQIHDYSTIWMENIIHNTAKGSSEFGLANTNKLIKQYAYATGLKTGSTDQAKYCVSATAEKDGISLIAVIMAAPDYKVRFADATALLNYGFSCCKVYQDENKEQLSDLTVTKGVTESVPLQYEGGFSYLDTKGDDINSIQKVLKLPESVKAPVKQGDVAGKAVYMLGNQEIGSVNILYTDSVEKADYRDYLGKLFRLYFS